MVSSDCYSLKRKILIPKLQVEVNGAFLAQNHVFFNLAQIFSLDLSEIVPDDSMDCFGL